MTLPKSLNKIIEEYCIYDLPFKNELLCNTSELGWRLSKINRIDFGYNDKIGDEDEDEVHRFFFHYTRYTNGDWDIKRSSEVDIYEGNVSLVYELDNRFDLWKKNSERNDILGLGQIADDTEFSRSTIFW